MKILLISNGFPPQRWAGTETYTAGIAKELRSRGHEVNVLCAGQWEDGPSCLNGQEQDCHDGIVVTRLHLNWKKAPDPCRCLYDNPVVAKYLASLLRESRPDLVHVTSCETMSASVLKVIKEARIASVLTITDFWFLCPRINLLRSDGSLCNGQTAPWDCLRCNLLDSKAYRWPRKVLPEQLASVLLTAVSQRPALTRRPGLRGMAADMSERKAFLIGALNLPDARMTASPFVRDLHKAKGVSAPILVRPYGHDLSWLKDYPGKTPSETVRIGFIGQITESKGVHLLLEASNALSLDTSRFRISVYGNLESDPTYGARLRALASERKNVEFLGTYPHERTGQVFTNLDALVVPSTWYDFPLIIHEAFATKTPVIATRLPTIAESVSHEVNGLLFECGDVEDLARQLHRAVSEPGLLERLRAGILPVKTIAEEANEVEAVYGALIARKRSEI